MWFEVLVLERVRRVNAAAVDARTDKHQRLVHVGRQAPPVLARPLAGEIQRIGAREDLVLLRAPSALHEVVRRGDGAA